VRAAVVVGTPKAGPLACSGRGGANDSEKDGDQRQPGAAGPFSHGTLLRKGRNSSLAFRFTQMGDRGIHWAGSFARAAQRDVVELGAPVPRCSQENLRGAGGDGLFYCFAAK
jgi:hypothetical protein